MSLQEKRYLTRKWLLVAILGVVLTGILTSLWYVGVLNDNFRTVTPGKCYRSGQMSYGKIRETVTAYGIRTLINLKGKKNERWYFDEMKAVNDTGIHHIDIDLNPWMLPPPQEVVKLLDALKKEPYPILIHCQAGSDRTGLACVLYRMVVEHIPLESALAEQLTWRYGHWAYGNARAMDLFFEFYRQTGGSKDIVRWIREDYPSIYAEQKGKT